jgi:RNA polymerase sigma factor (sigma-70 family)
MTTAIPEEKGIKSTGLAWALEQLAQHRDAEVWVVLVDQASSDIQRLACRLIGDSALAEDAVQETLLLVRDHAARFSVRSTNGDNDARRWIMSVATHASLQIARRHAHQLRRDRNVGQAEAKSKPPINDPSLPTDKVEQSNLLRRELAALPDIYGQAITLHYFADQDYPTLAVHLSMSVNAVRNRVHRGLKLLRERLDRCGMTLSIAALTGLISNLGAAPVAVAAMPTSTLLGIISSNTTATTTLATASASIVTTGTLFMTAISTVILAATVSVMSVIGWSFDWFNSVTDSSMPIIEVSTPLPLTTPAADAKEPVKPLILVVKTDQKVDKKKEKEINFRSNLLPSGLTQFRLPLHKDYAYDFTINWGDGTKEVINKSFPQLQSLPEAIAKQFEQEVTFDFSETTLKDAVVSLGKSAQVKFILDLNEAESNATITLKVTSMKLVQALSWISRMSNLETFYGKDDNAIILTSEKNFEEKLSAFHTYSNIGTYAIEITENVVGGFPAIDFSYGADSHKLISIDQWGGGTWKSLNYAFFGCYNLTIAAHDSETALTGDVTDFSYAWAHCSALQKFPMLNTAAGTNFGQAWRDCSGLTSFPLLNTAAGTNFDTTWGGCSGLTSFPLLNTSAGTNFHAAWGGCSGLTSFPLLNTIAGNSFDAAWSGCSGLTSFPLLNTSAGTRFVAAWKGCSGLTSFPLLNTAAGTDFNRAWQQCKNLKFFPALNFGKMTDGKDCFDGVTLDADSYSDLLNHLAAVNVTPKLIFDGGLSKMNEKAIAARKILTTDRGWTIYDADAPKPIKKPIERRNRQKPAEATPPPKPQEVNEF